MRKLTLNVDDLRVESFAVAREEAERGTVRAHLRYTDPQVCPYSKNWYCSVGDGCTWAAYTCAWTCAQDCFSDNDFTCAQPCDG